MGQRDDHLRPPDSFDVARFPTITFQSTAVERRGEGRYRVTGDLTMHGQTHPVTLEVEAAEPVKDPWGNQRVAASATGKLNRKTWGLELESGSRAGSLDGGRGRDIHLRRGGRGAAGGGGLTCEFQHSAVSS